MPSISLGVIGAGYWGPKLVRTALATPQFQLRWLCDHHEERPGPRWASSRGYGSPPAATRWLGDPEVAAMAIVWNDMDARAPVTDGAAGVRMIAVPEAASRSAAQGGILIPVEAHAEQATVACMVPLSARLGPALLAPS